MTFMLHPSFLAHLATAQAWGVLQFISGGLGIHVKQWGVRACSSHAHFMQIGEVALALLRVTFEGTLKAKEWKDMMEEAGSWELRLFWLSHQLTEPGDATMAEPNT